MDNFDDLQRLLTLKRHEAPPPEYFEDFLVEFHQRQRAELLKRPLWKLAVDRLEAALPVVHFPRYAYAGGCAVALCMAGVASTHILRTPVAGPVADNGGRRSPFGVVPVARASSKIDFYASRPAFRLSELDFNESRLPAAASVVRRPRYVLDSQPVSYEQPFSF